MIANHHLISSSSEVQIAKKKKTCLQQVFDKLFKTIYPFDNKKEEKTWRCPGPSTLSSLPSNTIKFQDQKIKITS